MNGKAAKMLRKLKANDNVSKSIWKSLNHIQRGKIRSVFKKEGPERALVLLSQFSK